MTEPLLYIGGDLFLGGDALARVDSNIVRVDAYSRARYRIANLEHPIFAGLFRAGKSTLVAPPSVVRSLGHLRMDGVGLANNHMHDCGANGIETTLAALHVGRIGAFGAGPNVQAAMSPFKIPGGVYILAACERQAPYIRDVMHASSDSPGVAPLDPTLIEAQLDELPADARTILFIHWGREHVAFPPRKNILLARRLLAHRSVIGIVGTHPHVVQGVVRHAGKVAFMSIGHLFFSPFVIGPPTQIVYPTAPESVRDTTFGYHSVAVNTRKRWRLVNRVGLGVTVGSDGAIEYVATLQARRGLEVRELRGIARAVVRTYVNALSAAYALPACIYEFLEAAGGRLSSAERATTRSFHSIKQRGLREFMGHVAGVRARRKESKVASRDREDLP